MLQVFFEIPTQTPWFTIVGVLACLAIVSLLWWKSVEPGEKRSGKNLAVQLAIALAVSFFALRFVASKLDHIPIYGFGVMLFLAFILCTWLAGRRAAKQGIPAERIQDLAIWLFVGGISGSRLTYFIVEDKEVTMSNFFTMETLKKFFSIWDGGLVLYGSIIGGALSFFLAYLVFLRKHGLTFWQLADIVAPSLALGVCLGRIGCLLNGCCYGGVACPDCQAIPYPLAAAPRFVYTEQGYQTAAGFTLDDHTHLAVVGIVEKGSAADAAGLRNGDLIIEAIGKEIHDQDDLDRVLSQGTHGRWIGEWPRGQNDLTLTVVRRGDDQPTQIGPFYPKSIGLYPTQIHESISTFLILLLILAFEPFKRRDGSLMVLFLLVYPIHRFIDEMLRNDTERYALGMTFSQFVSFGVFACAVGLSVWLWRFQPPVKTTDPQPA
jgi:phosphatidylglycerol:prolipoprotein diacylglycerol transferase